MAKMPTNIEELRNKYKVMANMFLLAKMRQPSRHLYKDLDANTFSDFLDELLNDRNFLMETADDEHLVLLSGTNVSITNFRFVRTQLAFAWKKVLPSKSSFGTPWRTKSIGCNTGFSNLPSRTRAANLPKCRRWNSEWLLLRTDSRIALAHHAASRTSVHYRHLNRCSRFQHPALNQKARPKDRKAKEKARTRVARHSLQIHLRFKASGTSRPCTKSVGQLGNSSQKTRVGNFNLNSVVHANMFA